ncbi:Gfo/Idh/MocA family protein [Sinobaca sp. H24]|uniref:Gfo/Idh/MocA family protein n=1 Tax=Sinobaca sp. H24 TaxID=2923376 RepID=UPI00207934E6|nr:Gfo/Idh/MocA family oxidoreductase [Sinobaca sp. H24]
MIKVGIIGCGSVAKKRHLPEYKDNNNASLVALCDLNKQRVDAASKEYGTRAYTDYKQMIQQEQLDAVSVCLPNYLHAEVTIYALENNLHVLCEKPMATSIEEAQEMIAVSEEYNKKLMIAHNQRFVDSHIRARAIVENQELGRVLSFRTTFGHGGPENWSIDGADSWFFEKDKAHIGSLGDLGVHKADLMRYLLGEEFIDVAAFVEKNAKQNSDVDDNAVCIVRTETGIIGTITSSWAYGASHDNSTILYCENGIVRMEDDPAHSLVIQKLDGEIIKHKLKAIQSNEEGGQTTTHIVDHFVECILENVKPPIDGTEGMKSLQIVLGALQSNEKREIIKMEETAMNR